MKKEMEAIEKFCEKCPDRRTRRDSSSERCEDRCCPLWPYRGGKEHKDTETGKKMRI